MTFERAVPPHELVGVQEIAMLAGVTRAAVTNWRRRHSDFPEAAAELAAGPVFHLGQIRTWLRRRIQMTNVISFINLKGGVAKSTTTVAVAQMLDVEFTKQVLVIDLDPQTNATVMLIGEDRWQEIDNERQTVAQLFADALSLSRSRVFDLESAIQQEVGNVEASRRVSLLPSSLQLIDLQDRLAELPPGRFYAANPTEILRRAVRPVLDEYDYVLIDCPPSMGLVTLNGLRVSNAYVIPTIPDILSTYGIPQIVQRVRGFAEEIGQIIEPLGIVATKFQTQMRTHRTTLDRLREGRDAPLFEAVIPQSTEIAAAADWSPRRSTLRQKWGRTDLYDALRRFVDELVRRTSPVEAQ